MFNLAWRIFGTTNGDTTDHIEEQELDNLYFLGRKNRKEIFIGKFTEMTMAGIISETVSKGIIEEASNMSNLLQ